MRIEYNEYQHLVEDEPFYLIVPAAGLGKRMKLANPEMPKEMLPVGNKPAIQYTVEEGISAGIKNIVIIINRDKEMICKYFAERKFEETDKEVSITFLYQKEPLGESDAISLAEDIVDGHASAIFYPDNIYFPAQGALKILKSVFKKYRTDVLGLMEITHENAIGIGNSGRVDLLFLESDIYRIEKFYPKSSGHFVPRFIGELRTCGITIVGPHIFEYTKRARDLARDGEFTDLPVRNLMLDERTLLGCRLPGIVFDIGNPVGYSHCVSYVKNILFPP